MTEEEKKDVEAKEEKKEETSASEEKVEEKKEETKEETADVEVPSEFKKIVEEIEKMTVLQLHELVKVLEAKFGVSAQAVAVSGGTGGDAGAEEEKDSFTVELKSAGDKKIAVIKVVKDVLGLGLKEAKDLVDAAPGALKEGVKKEEADDIKAKIEDAGGTVELK